MTTNTAKLASLLRDIDDAIPPMTRLVASMGSIEVPTAYRTALKLLHSNRATIKASLDAAQRRRPIDDVFMPVAVLDSIAAGVEPEIHGNTPTAMELAEIDGGD